MSPHSPSTDELLRLVATWTMLHKWMSSVRTLYMCMAVLGVLFSRVNVAILFGVPAVITDFFISYIDVQRHRVATEVISRQEERR